LNLSFGVIIFFLFEPINKDFWYVYQNIVTMGLGPGEEDLGSEIRDPEKPWVYDKTPAAFL
jgi:hypothetical protein